MLIGSYDYNIDEKGRVVIPSKFRNELGNTLYLTKGFDGCIAIYKESDFENTLKKLGDLKFEKEKARTYQRLLLETAVELIIDKAGRIQIPVKTLQKYKISKEIKIIGLLNHFEIWDRESYDNYRDNHEKDFEKDVEDLINDEN